MEPQETLEKNEVSFFLAKAVINTSKSLDEKTIGIENAVGLDFIYSLIASGCSEEILAEKLGLPTREFRLILRQNQILRNKYIEAKTFRAADSSFDIIDEFSQVRSLDKEEKNALDFHGSNVDRAIKNKPEQEHTTGVVINNVLNVAGNNDIPSLPSELSDIFDGEFEDVDS